MIEFGFTEKFYQGLVNHTWSGKPKQDAAIGLELKKEFEFLFDNIQLYSNGSLPQHKKERFDKALLGFHQYFPEYFKGQEEKIMNIIKEKSPTIYGTITQ